jgi:hypothetical protein
MSKQIPDFIVRNEVNDTSTQLRIQKIGNGFVVKAGIEPIFYPTIEDAADAIYHGVLAIEWEVPSKTRKPR